MGPIEVFNSWDPCRRGNLPRKRSKKLYSKWKKPLLWRISMRLLRLIKLNSLKSYLKPIKRNKKTCPSQEGLKAFWLIWLHSTPQKAIKRKETEITLCNFQTWPFCLTLWSNHYSFSSICILTNSVAWTNSIAIETLHMTTILKPFSLLRTWLMWEIRRVPVSSRLAGSRLSIAL